MKRLSVKYLAGLIDGEGCVDWMRSFDKKLQKRYIRPRLRITLTEPGYEVIDLLVNNFGGHVEVRKPKNSQWTPSKTWSVTASRAVMVLGNVKNSLIIKKEQAKLAIAWEKHLKGRHIPDSVKDIMSEEMKLMKKDPHRLSEKAMYRVNEALKR